MNALSAYSLQASLSPEKIKERVHYVQNALSSWLKDKGVIDPEQGAGTFKSLTGDGEGHYSIVKTQVDQDFLQEVELIEITNTGHEFTTVIQLAEHKESLAVFATLGVATNSGVIAPIHVYPRCPKVVRKLIDDCHDWAFAGQAIPTSKPASALGAARAKELCDELLNPIRNLPIVVVSIDPDEQVWPSLAADIARELVGLSQVAVVDSEGSWEMTDNIGKADSCYLGAVRLYWPLPRAAESRTALPSLTWTTGRLRTFGEDEVGKKKFLSQLRRMVFSASALTVTPSQLIRDIQNSAMRMRLRASDQAERERELDELVEENSSLAKQLQAANLEIAALKGKLHYYRERLDEGVENAVTTDSTQGAQYLSPQAGEIRFYKKIGSGGGVDTLIQTASCNHSAWRPAFKAVQAEKGIEKLEGRAGWQSMQHCGTCTGGGRWRVHW